MQRLHFLLAGACAMAGSFAEAAPRLRVHAGDHDRLHTLVSIQLPHEARGFNSMQDGQGQIIDLQIDRNGQGAFVEPGLKAGAAKDYTLVTRAFRQKLSPFVIAKTNGTLVQVTAPGLHPVTYHTVPSQLPDPGIAPIYARGGYIHPVLSPSGRQVTDDYPPNHIHHHGIWYAWTKTKIGKLDPDFWNMGQGKGTVEFAGLDDNWDGPVHGGWQARHRHRELMTEEKKVILEETWDVRVYRTTPEAGGAHAMFDIRSEQVCVADTPLQLPTYHYGGTGVRGNRLWDGQENAFFLTSEGITDRVAGNESRARWCYMGGMVDGRQTGIAILCHPDNYRSPQPVRLHPSEPYFSYAPQQLGEMQIKPGEPYVMQYRHVVFDGPPDRERLERMWQDYAHPPSATLLVDKN